MGTGGSKSGAWQGYEHQLLSQQEMRVTKVEGSEEEHATATYRSKKAQDSFGMFLSAKKAGDGGGGDAGSGDGDGNDEKSSDNTIEIDSGWLVFRNAAQLFKDGNCFGYRVFEDPMKDPGKRGVFKWDTYGENLSEVLAIGNGL